MKECLNCGRRLTGQQEKYCSTECCNQYYQINNREELVRKKREYRQKYPEKTRQYNQDNKERINKYYKDNKERILERARSYYEDNKEDILEYAKSYGRKNRKKISEYWNKWAEKNKKKLNKWEREYQKERRKDTIYKLNCNISSGIRNSLRSNNLSKDGRHWEDMVGYTVQELKEHLEKLFQPGMTWDNHGEWHIDHIIPKSFFQIKEAGDVEFRMCWRLENLQPLWADENLRKRDMVLISEKDKIKINISDIAI